MRTTEVTIGRKRGSNLRIPAATVSRQHCRLTFEEDTLVVHELGSFNGTFVNGKRIREKALVRSGDRLKIGPIVFIVKYGGGADVEEVFEAVPLSRVFEIGDSVDLSQDFGAALPMSDISRMSSKGTPEKKRRVVPPPVPKFDDDE